MIAVTQCRYVLNYRLGGLGSNTNCTVIPSSLDLFHNSAGYSSLVMVHLGSAIPHGVRESGIGSQMHDPCINTLC